MVVEVVMRERRERREGESETRFLREEMVHKGEEKKKK